MGDVLAAVVFLAGVAAAASVLAYVLRGTSRARRPWVAIGLGGVVAVAVGGVVDVLTPPVGELLVATLAGVSVATTVTALAWLRCTLVESGTRPGLPRPGAGRADHRRGYQAAAMAVAGVVLGGLVVGFWPVSSWDGVRSVSLVSVVQTNVLLALVVWTIWSLRGGGLRVAAPWVVATVTFVGLGPGPCGALHSGFASCSSPIGLHTTVSDHDPIAGLVATNLAEMAGGRLLIVALLGTALVMVVSRVAQHAGRCAVTHD